MAQRHALHGGVKGCVQLSQKHTSLVPPWLRGGRNASLVCLDSDGTGARTCLSFFGDVCISICIFVLIQEARLIRKDVNGKLPTAGGDGS